MACCGQGLESLIAELWGIFLRLGQSLHLQYRQADCLHLRHLSQYVAGPQASGYEGHMPLDLESGVFE